MKRGGNDEKVSCRHTIQSAKLCEVKCFFYFLLLSLRLKCYIIRVPSAKCFCMNIKIACHMFKLEKSGIRYKNYQIVIIRLILFVHSHKFNEQEVAWWWLFVSQGESVAQVEEFTSCRDKFLCEFLQMFMMRLDCNIRDFFTQFCVWNQNKISHFSAKYFFFENCLYFFHTWKMCYNVCGWAKCNV